MTLTKKCKGGCGRLTQRGICYECLKRQCDLFQNANKHLRNDVIRLEHELKERIDNDSDKDILR